MTVQTIAVILAALSIELTILIAALGFNTKMERRFGECLTRSQHEEICERRETETRCLLNDIKTSIDENEKRASNTRHDIRQTVHTMQIELAIMKGQSSKAGGS